jgi:fructose-specific phosphotransferase system IIC component
MEKGVEKRIVILHSAYGLVLGVLMGLYLREAEFTFLGALLGGIVLAYPLKLLSQRLYNLSEEEFSTKEWLIKGFFSFFIVWIIVWTFLYNL